MLMCLATVFDQGFKSDGGIGGYMEDMAEDGGYLVRFFYDNLFNIIVLIIMLNIVQGIIIDTFAILRQKQDNNAYDRNNKCFICGIKKEKIERGSNRPFRYHTNYEHSEWNYLYFIAYLKKKPATEHSGIETHVIRQISNMDIDWFPLNKALSLKEDITHEEEVIVSTMQQIGGKIDELALEVLAVRKQLKMIRNKNDL